MFEQASYFEVPAEPLREGDPFYNYEVGTWRFDNRIYAIFAIAAFFNFALLGLLAQTNFLTARGCDSPFVGRVCQVLDMAYVGTVLFGTERDYVDAEYERTDLGDAEVVWIDQTGVSPQLQYPEGYFQIANPDQYSAQNAMLNGTNPMDSFNSSGFPPLSPPTTSGSSLIDTPPVAPKKNKNAVVGEVPDSPFDLSDTDGTDKTEKPGKSNANKDPKSKDPNATAQNTNTDPKVDPTGPVNPNEINKRPFEDLGTLVNDKIAKNEVDIKTEFMISAKGKLTKEGRLDPKTFKYTAAASPDPDMIDVAKRGIEAINESGYLKYLADLSGKDLDLQIKQDLTNLNALVQTELESENRAKTLSSLISSLIKLKIREKEAPDASQNDKDDLILLQSAKVEQVGKKLVISFDVPKDIVHKMIERKLAEHAAESKKPSGNAVTTRNDNTAAK